MKKLFPIFVLLLIFSCKKSEETTTPKVDSAKIIDSINAVRTKINDSILSSRSFKDLEGTHILTHDMISGNGKISFTKIGQDEYKISGGNKEGSNFVKIEGTAKMTSPKNLKFDGTITQSISDYDNGKLDVRKGKRNFSTKDGGKTFKLYESVNNAGFGDKIIIKM
ncbi:hypothetical protein J2X97_000301 [Epilithonimonas hungarica]|jgi:hypothetical protein|uniref:hypothetical protein n=1 Tax=Epilithonimonas hungarica TaxID=454006 RepID=UPI0012C9E651|nr:hypothetical protein [Epilithonimonas hungarica]MDP9954664.1 hypothetical protein [Epilithonimonas hungarica]MPT31820.1 hypothetical protein [Chryseobacterium sp.]